MVGKIIIMLLTVMSLEGMHHFRLNGNFVSDEDMECLTPVQYRNGAYNVCEKEQLAVRFTSYESKHIWLYVQMISLPTPANEYVGFATRGQPHEFYRNFALDFKSAIIRKFKDEKASK